MQQRQLRLGDILDDYCPRERRVTNHAVVAMIGEDVKQTRCTTCDADHEYKHAKVPRQRRKTETPAALYSQVLANGPKRVSHEGAPSNGSDHDGGEPVELDDTVTEPADEEPAPPQPQTSTIVASAASPEEAPAAEIDAEDDAADVDGNRDARGRSGAPAADPGVAAAAGRAAAAAAPDSRVHHPPAWRTSQPVPSAAPGRRRRRTGPRSGGGQQFQGNRSNGNQPGGPPRGMRSSGGRPPHGPHGAVPTRLARRNGPGRKRSK